MGQVNRIPSGFLDLLGVESLGRNPPLFSDAISPIADLTEFYAGQTLSIHTEDFVTSAAQQQVVVRVPSEETWFLRGVSVQCTTLLPTTMWEQWSFVCQDLARNSTGGATAEHTLAVSPLLLNQGGATGVQPQWGFYFPQPGLAFTSGSIIKARIIERDALAGRTTACNFLINRYNS